MAEHSECRSCGAILAEEDQFCGECGAPRTSLAEQPEPAPGEQTLPSLGEQLATARPEAPEPVSTPSPPSRTPPSRSPQSVWRVAAIALFTLAAIACVSGLAGFLLVGIVGGENTTPQENWISSTLCCLLPVGGTGAILAAIGAAIWYKRLKGR